MLSNWADSSRGDVAGVSLGGGEHCFLRIGRGHGQYVFGIVGRGRGVRGAGSAVRDGIAEGYMKAWRYSANGMDERRYGCGISVIGPAGSWERRVESEGRVCFEKCAERRPLEKSKGDRDGPTRVSR